MLLEDLYQIVKRGAEKPLVFWLDDYNKIREKIAGPLEQVVSGLEEKTEVRTNADNLIALLKTDQPNELELAKSLSYIARLFNKDELPDYAELINNYVQDGIKFYNHAQTGEFYRLQRAKLKKTLAPAAQKAHDLKLFEHEGMLYCLEYYLALYKAIQDASSEEEKRKFIESAEVNLGFGNTPGLWIDFSRDEVLGKFIYSILSDDLRNRLTEAYFNTKIVMMRIERQCDKQNNCRVDYKNTTLEEAVAAFRDFINILLEVFQTAGIDRLASYFFTPYGKKPLIGDIKI